MSPGVVLVLVVIATFVAWLLMRGSGGAKAAPPPREPGGRGDFNPAATPASVELTNDIRAASMAGGQMEAIRVYVQKTGAPVSDANKIIAEFQRTGKLSAWKKKAEREATGPAPEAPTEGPKPGVADYLRRGDRDAAIARYCELTRGDVAQAERAIAVLEKELAAEAPGEIPPGSEDNPRELTENERLAIVKLLMEGKRVEAVDRCRRLTGKPLEVAGQVVAVIAEKVHSRG